MRDFVALNNQVIARFSDAERARKRVFLHESRLVPFYERYELSDTVTALEGANGAGKPFKFPSWLTQTHDMQLSDFQLAPLVDAITALRTHFLHQAQVRLRHVPVLQGRRPRAEVAPDVFVKGAS